MVTVYAPSSIGNINIGFDILGVAISPINGAFLGDCVNVDDSDVFNLSNRGYYIDQMPSNYKSNIVYKCWQRFCVAIGKTYPVNISLEKSVPVSSGLGSSASSIVATLVAMNVHCGNLLNDDQLLDLMAEMERKISGDIHLDNIVPSFLGGMRLILSRGGVLSQQISIFNNWLWIVAYPGTKISTAEARKLLPMQYSRNDCINNSRYLAGFIHACYTNQEALAVSLMQEDIMAEPYRIKLLPDYVNIRKKILDIGALVCGISGSGPTLFAICNDKPVASKVVSWLSKHYVQNVAGFVHICRVNKHGARVIIG